MGNSSPIPEFSPVKDLEFYLESRPKDIYHMLGKLSRHFIFSEKFSIILGEYNLSGHVKFKEVILRNKIESRTDFQYFHFYESMWDYLDIESSKFYQEDKNNPKNNRFVNFKSKIRHEEECSYLALLGVELRLSEVLIPGIDDFDLFPLLNLSENMSFFISERLYKRMQEDKISGAHCSELTSFQIR